MPEAYFDSKMNGGLYDDSDGNRMRHSPLTPNSLSKGWRTRKHLGGPVRTVFGIKE